MKYDYGKKSMGEDSPKPERCGTCREVLLMPCEWSKMIGWRYEAGVCLCNKCHRDVFAEYGEYERREG